MCSPRRARVRGVVFTLLVLGFGIILGLTLRRSVEPRIEGLPITGGTGGGMPGMEMSDMAMPPDAPGPAGERAARLARAHVDVEAGRFGQALPAYEAVLRDDPHNVEALIHLGVSLAGTERVEQGLATLDRALAMAPDNLHALWSKAQTLYEVKRDYAASIPLWEHIASLEPDSPDAANARGYALRARERLQGRGDSGGGRRSR